MRPSWLPLLLMLSLMACCIEVEISIPGFPAMAHDFSVSVAAVQLTITYNLLGFFLAAMIYGPLSETFGRRHVMVVGNLIMLIGACACVVAPTIHWLYIARFIQGLGAATSAVLVFAIISDAYAGKKSIQIIGMFNAVFTACMAIAPIIGSFMTQSLGWRGNYALIAVLTGIAWFSILLFLPETNKHVKPLQLSLIAKEYYQLISSRIFMRKAIVPSLLYAGYIVFAACSSFLYMNTLQLPMLQYAINLAIIIGVFAIVSLFTNHITAILGNKQSVIGSLIMIISGIAILLSTNHIPMNVSYLITLSMSLYCIGFAILYPIIFSQSLEIFPEMKGTASSAIMSMRTLLMALLIGLSSLIYNGTTASMGIILASITIIIIILINE